MKNKMTVGTIGDIILKFSMDCFKDHYHEFMLNIKHPDHFQKLCMDAAKGVKDAYCDTGDIYGWVRHTWDISDRFTKIFQSKIHVDDRDIFSTWLNNGYDMNYTEIKDIWFETFKWLMWLNEPVSGLTEYELRLAQDFWRPIKEEIDLQYYDDIKTEIVKNSISDHDEWIKIKFHLNLFSEFDENFYALDGVRKGNILIKHWRNIKNGTELYNVISKLPLVLTDSEPDTWRNRSYKDEIDKINLFDGVIQ